MTGSCLPRRSRNGAGWLTVSCLLVLLLVSCSSPAPVEQQVRARINAMQKALHEGKARVFMAAVADDFAGPGGHFDRRSAHLLVQREMLAHKRLKVRVANLSVNERGAGRAVAEFDVIATGGSGLLPETAGWYRVQTGWRLDGRRWMLVSASWDRVAGRG